MEKIEQEHTKATAILEEIVATRLGWREIPPDVGDLEAEADTIIQMENGVVREVVGKKSSPRQLVEIAA